MVVIAKNENGKVVSILNAKNLDVAKAYLQGKGVNYDTIRSLDDENEYMALEDHPTGVYALLETITVIAGSMDRNAKVLCVK